MICRGKISCERPLGAVHPDGLSLGRVIEGKSSIKDRIAISAAYRIEIDGSGNRDCQALRRQKVLSEIRRFIDSQQNASPPVFLVRKRARSTAELNRIVEIIEVGRVPDTSLTRTAGKM
jgi:hypothetical protein